MKQKDLLFSVLGLLTVMIFGFTVNSFSGGAKSAISENGYVSIFSDNEVFSTMYIVNEEKENAVSVKIEKHWRLGPKGISDSTISTITLKPGEKKILGKSDKTIGFIKASAYYKILSCTIIKD